LAIRFGVSSTVKNRLPRYSNFWDGTAVYSPFSPTGSYDALATYTVGAGGVASIEFAGIPNTYSHLQIRTLAKATTSGGASGLWFVNSDTTQSNYYSHFLVGNGSSASAAAYNNPYSWSYSDATFTGFVMDILDYTSTSKYKTIRTLRGWDNNGSGNISLESGLWKNTNAINTFKFQMDSGNLAQYSQVSLYGIRG
jgi:hypothetical protein